VDPSDHPGEAAYVLGLCEEDQEPTVGAVIGGRPADPGFRDYLRRFQEDDRVKGVRQVLHSPNTPPGFCLAPEFVTGARLLGEQGLCMDLCMRPTELSDAGKLADQCPDTRFVLDHCGNADPKAFLGDSKRGGDEAPWHEAEAWKRDVAELAKRENVVCKISGIVVRAPKDDWGVEDLAPIVNHCLKEFGPRRVLFGGDWPVCTLVAELREWIEALREIIANRPEAERRGLFRDNALRFYKLSSHE
ncbi:MAG: amidohydrolase family protein, partial [Planctomycetales bacterium]